MKKGVLRASAAAVGMLILILDSRAALSGIREGIGLCIRTLIPSLFPFFVLSTLLTGNLIGQPVRLLRPLCAICGVPQGAESLLAVGLLGGYPVGAQNIAFSYRSGGLAKSDAERMLAFCNNAGPAFIFGILGSMFSKPHIPWLLWGVHIVSALVVGILLSGNISKTTAQSRRGISVSEALESSVKVMALVCGWVMIFRMILNFLERWFLWMIPETCQIAIAGILELSNGCIQLGGIPSEGLRFILAGMMLSLGGLCVTMQTTSVTKGLSLKLYSYGKILQCLISLLLCLILQSAFPGEQRVRVPGILTVFIILLCLIFALKIRKMKKRSSIPAAVGV